MMSRTRKGQPVVSDNPATFANDLNTIDYRDQCYILYQGSSNKLQPVILVEGDVDRCLSHTNHLGTIACGAVLW